jgi:hypothetical protein
MVTFLSELNGMELWATDIVNAYLEAYTAEKLFIVAGPEFGELEEHMLIISNSLYGLRTSGLHWHERFSQGHFAKSQNLAFLVLICKKCKILRFHDLIAKIGIAKIGIAKIGIAKIGIPILAIHPNWDPDFSDPSRLGSQF